ncbi:pyridoxamine 5'-phosphate oxidase family protein [Actinophytocola sp.]|uniref:pyridoxamine 5'-phosphate oxidase family protein n=1 Tax=Actinophytocola sp. TaxID=1872138 RepID=UPI00345BED24
MGKVYEQIEPRLRAFIEEQKVFFVASAPLAGDGHVNLSPKGREGTLVVLDDMTVAYLDFGGSHPETVAHLRENGRITLMTVPRRLGAAARGRPVTLVRSQARSRGARSPGRPRCCGCTGAASRSSGTTRAGPR